MAHRNNLLLNYTLLLSATVIYVHCEEYRISNVLREYTVGCPVSLLFQTSCLKVYAYTSTLEQWQITALSKKQCPVVQRLVPDLVCEIEMIMVSLSLCFLMFKRVVTTIQPEIKDGERLRGSNDNIV